MPNRYGDYYGPMRRYQHRAGFNAENVQRIANTLIQANQYARNNNLYGRAYRGLANWAKEMYGKPSQPKYKKPKSKPTKQTKGNINTGGYTSYGMNYTKNIRTKGKKGWKGKLTIPHNKKKTRQYNKKLPHSIMQRYFLTPTSNLDSNNVLSFPQDMFTSNPSVDAKHMSSVVLKLSSCENHLDPHNYHIGKQLAPYSMNEYVGANTIVWENNATNTALQSVQIPYQVNKFPVSAYASRWMEAPSGAKDFEMPTSVITGVNLNLVFKAGGQPFDQTLCVKVVRCNLPVAFRSGEWASADGVVPAEVIQRELTNRGNFTSRLAFDTIWTKSILLRGIKGGNQKIPTIRLKKFIKTQYLRSTIRRVSTAGDQATLGSQALPNTYESQDGYFNNLFVVISSKCVDDQYVATITRDIPDAGLGDNQYTREELGSLRAIPPQQTNGEGLAVNKLSCFFRYGGQFSVYRRVKEADSGITGGLNQTASQVATLQDQINELQAIVGAHQDEDCTSCDTHTDTEDNDEAEDEDCGSGHQSGASPPSDGHTHPNNLTAEEHDSQCQHSH